MVGRCIFSATSLVHPVARSVTIAIAPSITPSANGSQTRLAFVPGSPHAGGNPVRSASITPRRPLTVQIARNFHSNTAACAGERNTWGKYVSTSLMATRNAIKRRYTFSETDRDGFMRYSASRLYLFFLNDCQQEIENCLARRLLGLSTVVTFAVDGRHFAAHRPQVRGQLAAVMDRMVQSDLQENYRRPLEHPAEIHHLHKLLAAQFIQRITILLEPFRIPPGNFGRCLYVLRNRPCRGVELPVDGGFQKPVLRCRNVPYQLHRALSVGVRPVLRLVRGHCFEHRFRRAVLGFQHR